MNTHSLTHPQPHGLSSINSCQIFDLLDFCCSIPALNSTITQNWRLFYWCVFSQWLLFVINCEPLAVSQLQSFIRSTNGEKGEEKQHTTTCQLPWSFFCVLSFIVQSNIEMLIVKLVSMVRLDTLLHIFLLFNLQQRKEKLNQSQGGQIWLVQWKIFNKMMINANNGPF